MTVRELNQDQLNELKVRYVFDHEDSPSWNEIVLAEHIPNEVIFEEYGHIEFVEEDFFCNQEDE